MLNYTNKLNEAILQGLFYKAYFTRLILQGLFYKAYFTRFYWKKSTSSKNVWEICQALFENYTFRERQDCQ